MLPPGNYFALTLEMQTDSCTQALASLAQGKQGDDEFSMQLVLAPQPPAQALTNTQQLACGKIQHVTLNSSGVVRFGTKH